MRVVYIFLGFLALTAARSFKKRGDDDGDHWVSGYLATVDNDFDDAKKSSIVSNIVNDMKFFKSVLEKTMSGVDQSHYDILNMLSGALQLVEMHEKKALEGHAMIPAQPASLPQGCTKDDVIALNECKPMVNQVLNCINGGSQTIMDALSSDSRSFEEKIGVLKTMIGKLAAELDNIRMLFDHCVKRDDDNDDKDDGDDDNHWVSGYLATANNDYDDAKKASIVTNIRNDLKYFKSVVEKTLRGENGDQSNYEILHMLSGAIHLVDMHEKKVEEGHAMIPVKPVTIPTGCTKDDIIALKECQLMVRQALSCIDGGTQAILDLFASDNDSFEDKIGALKSVIGKIVGELDNIRMLFDHCSKPFLPAHWEQAWKLTEADLSDADVTEQKYGDMGMKIYNDAKAIRSNLDILLSGKGTEREFKEAERHLAAAVMLAKLHEEQGAGSVQPEDVPVEAQCTKEEISKLTDCGEKYFRLGNCLRNAVDTMIQRMENNNKGYVGLVKYVKGVVLNIAKTPEVLEEIASSCSVLDIQHWERAWLITKEELQDPANLEKFKELGMRIHNDLVGIRENLAALLEGRGGDFGLALKHLEAAVKLATLHEEKGAGSITPTVIPVETGCTKDEILALDRCESKALKIGHCIKDTIDRVLDQMRTNTDMVEVAMYTKGSVLNMAKADAVIKDVIASCEKEDDERELKRNLLQLLRRRGN